MALFRCKPDAKYRWIFNWLHKFFGIASWCLASVAIWYSTSFRSVGIYTEGKNGIAPRVLMIVLWAGLLAALIALEVHLTVTERIGISERVGPGNDLAMERLEDRNSPGRRGKRKKGVFNKSWSKIRGIVLGLFVCLSIAITITLAYWIGTYSK